MLNSKNAYKKAEKSKQRKIKSDKKDTKYVLKYIDKQIKKACKQGKFYILLDNKVFKTRLFGNAHFCYIDMLPKVTDTLCIKGYDITYFRTFPKNEIKISWENEKTL